MRCFFTLVRFAILVGLVATLVACGSDDDDGGGMPAPTPTPEEEGHDHRDFEIGSTEEGGGQLDAEFDYDEPISLFFNRCLGGEGEECEGGTRIYSAVNPGFVAHGHDDGHHDDGHDEDDGHDDDGHDDEGEELSELLEGTEISIEVIAIDEGLSMVVEGETLNSPGQIAGLGAAPEFHSDAQSIVGITDLDHLEDEFALTFRLITDAPEYADSEELTIYFEAVEDDHEHEDDDHEHEDDEHEDDDHEHE